MAATLLFAATVRVCTPTHRWNAYKRARSRRLDRYVLSDVQPFHRSEPRPAARRPTARSLRPVRVSVAGESRPNGAHPQRQSRTPTRCIPTPSTGWRSTTTAICLNDIAFSYVFSEPQDGRQTVDVFMATGERSPLGRSRRRRRSSRTPRCRSAPEPNIVTAGRLHVLRRRAQRRVLLRLRRHQESFRHLAASATSPNRTSAARRPWTGVDSNTEANVFSTVLELPTERARRQSRIRIWGRCSLRRDGELAPRRPGRPPVGQQLLQHRRHQGGVQRQRTGERPRALDGPVRPPDGPHRQLHARGGDRRDRRRAAPCPTC